MSCRAGLTHHGVLYREKLKLTLEHVPNCGECAVTYDDVRNAPRQKLSNLAGNGAAASVDPLVEITLARELIRCYSVATG